MSHSDHSLTAIRNLFINSPDLARAVRQWLEESQDFLNYQFQAKQPVANLVKRRAALIDNLLKCAWHHFGLARYSGLALIAVGGYGRGELHPHSDIDLLILCRHDETEQARDEIEKLITFLWDIKLEIGSAVRSLKECTQLASEDITIATNLLESRTLTGDESLLPDLQQQTEASGTWDARHFFQAKLEEQAARHRKHNNTEYNLEPDIKNAPGGLRDIQMIGWVAKKKLGAKNLKELVNQGFLTPDEYRILETGQSFLWAIRYALHIHTGRNENRLLFDHQRAIAAIFGYRDSSSNLAVEQFMKRYYRTALTLSVLNDMLLQLFDEAIVREGEQVHIIPINPRFQICNDYLEITHPEVFKETPSAILELFSILGHRPEIQGIRATTIRKLLSSRHLIDETFRQDPKNIALFLQIMNTPHRLFTQLRRMKRYGVLGQYIPQFGQIIGLMQYDLFHRYTVDAHTLLVIRNMRRFRYATNDQKFPLAATVFKRIPKKELLYLAGLFHDIAKGRGGDHSELGAEDAEQFCLRHRLSRRDANLVAWLTRNHLLMSMTAQKMDLSDPDVINNFAARVGDRVHLDYLYALTVADINGTNPELWNGWRASLLRQLYTETSRALRRGLENPIDRQDWIDDTRASAYSILLSRREDNDAIFALWDNLGDDYFLRESAEDIAWHTQAIIHHDNPQESLVLVKNTTSEQFEGASQIFIYTKDRPNLFASVVSTLGQLHLNILDARIITTLHGYTADTFVVLEENGKPIGENQTRIQEICAAIKQGIQQPDAVLKAPSRLLPRQLKHFSIPTEVTISTDVNLGRTVIEIITLDRPGLLAAIGQVFAARQVKVHAARIGTLGERAEDVFFVTQQDDHPLGSETDCEQLKQHLQEVLDNPPSTPDGQYEI